MASSSNNPHVEIRPKPANGRNASGAVSQIVTPRRRAGPLVFVNTSDLNTENEKQGNRKMVKKWAMLNRNARYMRPSHASSQKSQFLSWDSRSDREPSTASTLASAVSDDSTASPTTVASRDALLAAATKQTLAASPIEAGASLTHALNNLCLDLDSHAKLLLENFLKGDQNDVMLPTGRLVSANRGVFPMLQRSPAALCSMIATLETNPSNNLRSGRKDYRDYYLSMALMHTNTLIQKMDREPTPVVFFCVSLLMWIAKHMGDEGAMQAHFNGMIALMIRHWDLFTITPYLRNGPYFWTLPHNEGTMLPGVAEPSMYSLPNEDHTFFIDLSDFADLQTHGWISADLVSFLPHILAMNSLVGRAKQAQLTLESGRDLFAYILYNARMLTGLESAALTRFEHCIRMCAIIQYYSSVYQNPQQAVGWLAGPIHAHLVQLDLGELMSSFPRVLLWIALTAGHFATGSSLNWWSDLLASMVGVLGINDFESAVSVLENRVLWTHALDNVARGFWASATEDSRRSSQEPI